MGRGGAVITAENALEEAPRLTAVLRAATAGMRPMLDLDKLAVARSKALEARRKQLPGQSGIVAEVGAVGTSKLPKVLYGSWEKAPKPAREQYTRFLRAVMQLLASDVPSAELHEAAAVVWDTISSLPPPETARGRGPTQLLLGPHKEALTKALGSSLDLTAVQPVIEAMQAVRIWANQLTGGQAPADTSSSGDSSSTVTRSSTAALGAGSGSGSGSANTGSRTMTSTSGSRDAVSTTPQVWGSSIPWTIPAFVGGNSSDDRVGAGAETANGGTEAAPWPLGPLILPETALKQGAAGAGGLQFQGLGPSPEDVRQMALGSGRGAQPGRAAEDEEYLGEEYQEGKGVKEINLSWLQRWSERVSGSKGDAAASVAETAATLLLVHATSSAEELAGQMAELIGFEAAEHIADLLNHRRLLVGALQLALAKIKAEDDATEKEAAMPVYGSQVTITSTSAKQKAKAERKEARKQGAKGGKPDRDADVELLQEVGWAALLDTEKDHSATLNLGNGMEFAIGGDGILNRKALPAGTVRKTYKGYEEVSVPAPPRLPPPTEDELIQISDLPDWAQLAFAGFKTLNRIQSRIFKTAFNSNENLLVCAPTGAGKTNIAMISVLREVGENMRFGVIQKADFKVVYVAPMKALAAEVTAAFSKRLAPLGLIVRELTGDMQLTKKELAETQMIVTTPEKWDVITRKGGDVSVASLVKLLIIDEVHLLNDDRGPVIETLVARTQRQVESSQAMIRVVGLSATLPNYQDVARFLNVNLSTGLFHFDASYRPVPLELSFVGISEGNFTMRNNLMTEVCYNKVVDSLRRGHQVMVFVHSRKDTGKTARALADLAVKSGTDLSLFDAREHPKYSFAKKDVGKSRNRELAELFDQGYGIHHAGMLRGDRSLTERLFADGLIKVLVCTATLAWGVNLPAHTVIIKGTQVYDAKKGTFTDLGMLDVQQIFGRAGRPQFDTSGEATIITSHAKLAHYLGMLTHQLPIESQFKSMLVDNLNAEIVLGTVTNVREAATWLSYTYLNTRISRNPLAYGLTYQDLALDPDLQSHKRTLIVEAAKQLKNAQMAVFDERSGNLYVTELGRVASHFYIRHESIVTFNSLLKPHMTEAQILAMVSQSHEFESMMSREEEMPELDQLVQDACPHDVRGGVETKNGKANVLMQAYVSRARVDSFSLIADMMYVSTNVPRILRAVFEICLRRKWSSMVETLLTMCKSFEKRLWWDAHPLRQFETQLEPELLSKLEDRGLSLEQLQDMSASEIGAAVRHPAKGGTIKGCVDSFPSLHLDAQLQPITRTVLRISLTIKPTFTWKDKTHGQVMRWLILVEDSANEHIYHSETWLLTKKMAQEGEQKLAFTIPIFEPLPTQYYVRAVSDEWLHAEALLPLSFVGLILPERMPPHTELLDLDPLPLSALNNPAYQAMYTGRFTHFNPIQTQAFHTLYHTDEPVLLGAPTGSGKTISSELTMLRVFSQHPDRKIIYIAPLKALVRERIEDWSKGLCKALGKSMVELTGDYTPDLRALLAADIIIATPEKWDGISRHWQTRGYVKKVGLVVIDEIHLLGADRGPILEVIVSRMRYIAAQTGKPVRFVGLSTALANAQDLADWLGVGPAGLFNFKPSVRPVPMEAHIQGYPGKFYCPRMASMNKPCYAAIQMHSPTKPVLVFVSSRRQTRLTALDLITYAVADMRPTQWVHMSEFEQEEMLAGIKDASLKHTLQFGIGLHHAGLNDRDRSTVERLFVENKIQILVATSTLAWGVNTPAHLVIIKGTEFYDAPTKRYVDFPITDVLQMMGRAGRPQYDHHGVAVIMVHEPKKQFYKRFLYEPFPVESSLPSQIADHFNAEVCSGTITCKQDALDYLTWTYFYRRLVQNPSYYDLQEVTPTALNEFLSQLVDSALCALEDSGCVVLGGETGESEDVQPTTAGRVASFYYLQHTTLSIFTQKLHAGMKLPEVIQVVSSVSEFDELPVRHNEDKLNAAMARTVRYPVDPRTADDPHTKTHLLIQAHLSRSALPISDYITDTKGVLDNVLRILQAMVDVCSDGGWLGSSLAVINTIQSIMQARWADEDPLLTLPHIDDDAISQLNDLGVTSLPALIEAVLGPHTSGSRAETDQSGNKGVTGSSSSTAKQGSSSNSRNQNRPAGRDAKPRQGGGSLPNREVLLDALAGLLGDGKARDVSQVLERLPVISVKTQKPQLVHLGGGDAAGVEFKEGKEEEPVPGRTLPRTGESVWQVEVVLTRLKPSQGSGRAANIRGRPTVYAPRYPKVKDEGWYLVAGDVPSGELLALKRVGIEGCARPTTVRVTLPRTTSTGVTLTRASLFLMSDSYLGLDQEVVVNLLPNPKQDGIPKNVQLTGSELPSLPPPPTKDGGVSMPGGHQPRTGNQPGSSHTSQQSVGLLGGEGAARQQGRNFTPVEQQASQVADEDDGDDDDEMFWEAENPDVQEQQHQQLQQQQIQANVQSNHRSNVAAQQNHTQVGTSRQRPRLQMSEPETVGQARNAVSSVLQNLIPHSQVQQQEVEDDEMFWEDEPGCA